MRSSRVATWAFALVSLVFTANATLHKSPDYQNDEDLDLFVSRPDIRSPKFKIKKRQSYESSSPGYLFVAPYADLRFRAPSTIYTPAQTGPHLYDHEGNLVWSGAHLFGHRPTFDFKASVCNGHPCLTFILHEDLSSDIHTGGAGVILDSSFTIRDTVATTAGRGTMNMHEFTVTENGTALYITYSSTMTKVGRSSGFVGDNGFREVDIRSGKVIFEWWALDHVDPTESLVRRPPMPGSYSSSWDFFHMNSVDKNAEGDYLISSRYLNSIFKISGKDGSIIWQLGGRKTSFALQGFDFSSQHHARFIEESSSHAVISFLNNAADDVTITARESSAMYVHLDLKNMTATLAKKFNRPDQGLTRLRGNAQKLPNDNLFVSWSENALVSEFDPHGNCLFEGQFASHRFVTYRAYKFNFTSTPSEPPRLAAQVYASSPNTSITAMYVSWNGATEVQSWRFYGAEMGQDRLTQLGEVRRTGFETALMVSGPQERVYAEAVAADGTSLAESAIIRAVPQAGVLSAPSERPEEPRRKKLHGLANKANPITNLPSDNMVSFKSLAIDELWQSPVIHLVVFLASSCGILCLALGFALYRIRRLTSGGILTYMPVKPISLG